MNTTTIRFSALTFVLTAFGLASCVDAPAGPAKGSANGVGGAGAAAGVAGGNAVGGHAAGGSATGGNADPELLSITDFEYAGAFRLPPEDYGSSSIRYAQGPIAYHPGRKSVFLVGHAHHQQIAEFAVPALVKSNTVTDLNMAAAPTQSFVSVMSGLNNPQDIDVISGMAIIGDELVVNAQEYYDSSSDNSHTTLVVRNPSSLASSKVDGYFSFDGRAHASGWLSPVPSAWQSALGGTWITGNSSGTPIISRLSVGPTAFAFDPTDLAGAPSQTSTTTLLDYHLDNPLHDDLFNSEGENDVWTHLSRAIFGFIPPGTRTYATFGHTGGHDTGVCYKCVPVGSSTNSDCGGYCAKNVDDYRINFWFYDVDDLIAVREGTMQSHEVKPYAHGEFPIPFATDELGGGSYDPASGNLYLTAQRADREEAAYGGPPIVMVYNLGL